MKKTIVVTFGVLVVAALALAIIPTTRDEIHWRWASYTDATASYESYTKSWPEGGKYVVEAKDRIQSLRWQDATKENTVNSFERFIKLHSDSKYAVEAKDRIESLRWQEATRANTIKSYRTYISANPQGKFAQQAETKATALRTDQAPYEAARRTGTEASFEAFLNDYPGHASEAAAREVLREIREGRDIVDLLDEKKIEVQAQGAGIDKVSIRLRRLVPYSLTVRIPVGSFFISSNPSAQNMVTTAESKVRLITMDWQSVSPAAACANRPKDIPGSGDTFKVQRSPNQAELTKLMPILDRARVDTYTRQAAVWIVTDNANYDDLGVLVVNYGGISIPGAGVRAITEKETARAMRICDEAGIDITKRAVWRDRQRINSGLQAGDVKTWLEQKK